MGNSAKPGLIILISRILGLFMSAIEQLAYDSEYIFHLYVSSAEIPGLQILTIVLFLLAGGALAAISS